MKQVEGTSRVFYDELVAASHAAWPSPHGKLACHFTLLHAGRRCWVGAKGTFGVWLYRYTPKTGPSLVAILQTLLKCMYKVTWKYMHKPGPPDKYSGCMYFQTK